MHLSLATEFWDVLAGMTGMVKTRFNMDIADSVNLLRQFRGGISGSGHVSHLSG